ncbi:MAG: cytochrome c maturation protein CcmE [Dehalococcoidia bacterium]|nr:cytochrome c maturation protein CcmE [Dehalococcoidia bacterium]
MDRSLDLGRPTTGSATLQKNQKLIIGVALIVLAVGYLIATSMQQSAVYYLSISEVKAKGVAPTEQVRVNGLVLAGSIEPLPNGQGVRFIAVDDKDPRHTMRVTYRGLVPDTFKDGSEIVVEGKLNGDAFEATTLLAKCPSKFTAEEK